ncbi:MAG: magnesium transporter [Acidimicrobiia bacterium]
MPPRWRLRPWRPVVARFRRLVRRDADALRQGFVALLIACGGSFLAGLTLGAIEGTLEELPGLLLLVPAAIGMRGNIFGALGSRLGTAIRTGTFVLSRRTDTLVGQNITAAVALSLVISLLLAFLAKLVAIGFGLPGTISVPEFVVISVVGGALSSVVVLAITVAVAEASVRRGWDLDNVAAPIVTAAGDVATLPALYLATLLVDRSWLTDGIAGVCIAGAFAVLVLALRSKRVAFRRIIRESLPILAVAGVVDVVAGLTIEKRLDGFLTFPALLILIPPFLEASGALGGILTSRVSTKLHLGLVEPSRFSLRPVGEDVLLTVVYAIPVFFLVGVSTDLASLVTGRASPGVLDMIGVAMLAGTFATAAALVVAYYGAAAAYRFGLDPDNFGIPVVTSSLDLLGAYSIVIALVMLGIV